ncbi:hypothetical protein RclHR1_05340006 [Rhizophagus clarus]|uniref:Sequence orphan n=1 Tax=Rhizophagus clarus TaxID=94130 RepID=A0A2Z6S3Y4_9GLOM|nr:hypothetical protein RclHR1_05340006 [Rhizophagus clarus]GES82158.1 hypothetical protein GLOIN_2v1876708 [Rhizophagus clarus]
MYRYNIYIFLFTLLLLFNHIPTSSSQCIETPLFGKTHNKDCPSVADSLKNPLNKITDSLVDDGNSGGGMIKIMFTCDKNAKPELCNKADIAFNNAAKIVENTFDLKVPVIVNASFVNLCDVFTVCVAGQPQPLGAAAPSRYLPIKDSDGATRLFPQALVKQLQLFQHPEFAPTDILAGFNSNSDVFWFRGDPPIGKDQVDFEIVLVHEFLHGLGFLTSWDDYFNKNASSLTPTPSFVFSNPEDGEDVKKGSIAFTGFQEYALDKFLVLTKDNSSLTLITNQLNQFTSLNTTFPDEKAFLAAFTKSPQYELTKEMFQNAITRGTVAIRLADGENALLETSLVPYKPGSTFSHVDFNAFANSTDFLMRFKAPRQVTLDNLTSINGNDPNYTNPIGPKTISILQSLGYVVKPNAGTFKISDQTSNQNLTAPAQNSTTTNSLKSDQQVNNAFATTTKTLSQSLLLPFLVAILILF